MLFVPATALRQSSPTSPPSPPPGSSQVVPCPTECLRCSHGALAATPALAKAVGVPCSLHICPLGVPTTTRAGAVPLVHYASSGMLRCEHCRAFVCPFASFTSDGSRWVCALCGGTQDLPERYRALLDSQRPELSHCCVEYVAPAEYMSRKPMSPCFVFVIDISRAAVRCGMLAAVLATLTKWAARYEGGPGTRAAFVLYARTVALVTFRRDGSSTRPYELRVLPDLKDCSIESVQKRLCVRSESLMVPLAQERPAVTKFLGDLSAIAAAQNEDGNALPNALCTVVSFARFWGGRVIAFNGSTGAFCDTGPYTIPPPQRQPPRLAATAAAQQQQQAEDEKQWRVPEAGAPGEVYKDIAMECCQRHISVDVVLAASAQQQPLGVATVEQLAHHTAGALLVVRPAPHAADTAGAEAAQAAAMRSILGLVCRPTAWESVLQLYVSPGVSVSGVTGNYFARGTDTFATLCADSANTLLADVTVTADNTKRGHVCIQAAYTYTTATANRRVRVMTLCLPCVANAHQVYSALDVDAVASSIAKHACQSLLDGRPVHDAREAVVGHLLQAMRSYRAAYYQGQAPLNSHGLALPTTLEVLPLYVLALLKSAMLTQERVRPDHRAALLCAARALPACALLKMFHPRLYDLTPLAEQEQEQKQQEMEKLPMLPLTETALQEGHVYLLESTHMLGVYGHGTCSPSLVNTLFGVGSIAEIPAAPITENRLAAQSAPQGCALISHLMADAEQHSLPTPHLIVLRSFQELQPLLVCDHTHEGFSYQGFIAMLAK